MGVAYVKAKNVCKELQRDNEELRKVLRDVNGFKSLEETVEQLSTVLFTKRNDQLNREQK